MTNKPTLPLEACFINVGKHKMAYLDEGKGKTILIVHGIPEWSMLYAPLIKQLADKYRCVVPDHLGFGQSDKDADADLTPAGHAQRLLGFVEVLGLKDIHLVVHDYGGPIGIGAMVLRPELFKSLTIGDSWLWDLTGSPGAGALKMMSGGIGKWLYLNYGFSVKVMAKSSFADKAKFNAAKDLFLYPHQTKEERYANYRLMLEMLRSADYFDTTLRQLKQTDVPMQLVWSMKDKFFNETFLKRWQAELPNAAVKHIDTSGHFPQLEAPAELARFIAAFIG